MGSWNETCAVSRLSIRSGEKIVLVPIAQNPWNYSVLTGIQGLKDGEKAPTLYKGASGVYSTDLWAPISLPIFGKYNDYGSIEDISSPPEELEQFVKTFKELCVPLEVGENEYHDVPTGKLDIGEILELVREGRAYTTKHTGVCTPTVPLGFAMIKKTVWDALLEIDLKKNSDAYFYRNEYPTPESILKKMTERHATMVAAKAQGDRWFRMEDGCTSSLVSHSFNRGPFRVNGLLENEKLLKPLANLEFFYIVMDQLRISLAPTIGSGSQSENIKLWKSVNTKINKIIQNEIKLDKENE